MPNATPMDKNRATDGIIEEGMYTVELIEYGQERTNDQAWISANLYWRVANPNAAAIPVINRITGEPVLDEKTGKALTAKDYIIRFRVNPRALGTRSTQRPVVTALLGTEITGGIDDDNPTEVAAFHKMLEGRQCKAFIALNERGYPDISNFKPLKTGPLGPVQDIRALSGLTKASAAAVTATLNPETKRPQQALAVAGASVNGLNDLAE